MDLCEASVGVREDQNAFGGRLADGKGLLAVRRRTSATTKFQVPTIVLAIRRLRRGGATDRQREQGGGAGPQLHNILPRYYVNAIARPRSDR